jgi:hypothetical protein
MVAMPEADAGELFRVAAVRFDAARAADALQRGEKGSLHRELHAKWHALLAGHPDPGGLQQIERSALAQGLADVVVDAASLRALALAHDDDALATALDQARRASRMARTEALPEQEYLANLVLARLRRQAGCPYLAARILGALGRYASPLWHPWIAWELALAAGAESLGAIGDDWPVRHLHALLVAASQRRDLRPHDASLAGIGAFARADVTVLHGALDPDYDSANARLEAWRSGLEAQLPCGLIGVAGAVDVERARIVVILGPERAGRRVLCIGSEPLTAYDVRLEPLQRRESRTDAIVAELALAGPRGEREEVVFARVWGFAYVPERHQAVMTMAISRARARVSGLATLARHGDRLVLTPQVRLVVPEPRGAPHADDRVLSVLAQRGRASASDLAEALGVPLRTVQASLKALVGEHFCAQDRRGRAVEYVVEDTTFQEPTRA